MTYYPLFSPVYPVFFEAKLRGLLHCFGIRVDEVTCQAHIYVLKESINCFLSEMLRKVDFVSYSYYALVAFLRPCPS